MHLFVVLLGPTILADYGQAPQILAASVCSIKVGLPHDTACVLQPGDHAFVQHPSFVSYRHMCVEPEQHVLKMVEQNVWPQNQPCSPQLVQQLIAGVCASKLTPRIYKGFFGCP